MMKRKLTMNSHSADTLLGFKSIIKQTQSYRKTQRAKITTFLLYGFMGPKSVRYTNECESLHLAIITNNGESVL